MKIAIGSDERTHLTDLVVQLLATKGHEPELVGALAGDDLQWPDVAERVGRSVAAGHSQEGVLFCWTGTGVCIAANKVPGVRAALCQDAATAKGARQWNHANVLVMGLRLTSEAVASEILEAWFNTPFGGGEDAENVAKIAEMERRYPKQAQ